MDRGVTELARLGELQKRKRLDTSVEMWVLLPWYEPLFDQATRVQAERNLRQLVARLAR
jgi:hypothetical protein